MDVTKVSLPKSFFKSRIKCEGFAETVWMSCVIMYGIVLRMKQPVYMDTFRMHFKLIFPTVVLIAK